MNYHLLIIGSLAAIIYSYLFLPKHEGGTAGSDSFTIYPLIYKDNIKIPVSSKKMLHIHHWLIYLILTCVRKNFIYCVLVIYSNNN
jgi:hypothetical protein